MKPGLYYYTAFDADGDKGTIAACSRECAYSHAEVERKTLGPWTAYVADATDECAGCGTANNQHLAQVK